MTGAPRAMQPGAEADRRIARFEDPRLLTGRGRYTADVQLADTLHASFVRSPVPHGRIRSIQVEDALAMDGVERVVTAEDVAAAGLHDFPVSWIHPDQLDVAQPLLARDKVLWVGQAVAVVIADDPYVAEDAAEEVFLEIDPLPAVVDGEKSLEGETLLHEDWGTNVFAEYRFDAGDVDSRFEDADVTIERRFRIHRHAGVPLEPRAALARHDETDGETTAWLSAQVPHHCRTVISEVLGVSEAELRIIAADVGGGFGVKEYPYVEDALVCFLARELRRPVKWVEDRREHFMSAVHAREQIWDVELAADGDARIRAVRGRLLYVGGGHSSNQGLGVARLSADMLLGPYDIQDYRMHIVGLVTNKVPAGAYRAFGRAQATFVMERLVDELAKESGIDAAEVRRRNLIRTESQPYTTATMHTYDGGDYIAALDRALETIDYPRLAERRREAEDRGRRRGLGIATMVMAAGLAPSKILGMLGTTYGGYETIHVRMDPSGKAVVYCGSSSQGQGLATTLAQVCAGRLGIPAEDVVVRLGDTASTPYSPAGAIASRMGSVGGGAVVLASNRIREKLARVAAHMLEANSDDIELEGGRAFVRGSRSSGLSIPEVAHAAHLGHDLPEGVSASLEATETFEPPNSSYPYATHLAEVEIDPSTGQLEIVRYVVVHDCGKMINPMIVEGQIVGGVAQGIGGALMEHLVYDDAGQLTATSFMDYLMPTATEIPRIEIEHLETPTEDIPGGMKGVGEAGTVAPAAALSNAVSDALGLCVDQLPLDPDRIWKLASSGKADDSRES